jgi:hypothetical protein
MPTMLAKARVCGLDGGAVGQQVRRQGRHRRGRAAAQDFRPERHIDRRCVLARQARQVALLRLLHGDGNRRQHVRDQVDGEDLPRGQRRGEPKRPGAHHEQPQGGQLLQVLDVAALAALADEQHAQAAAGEIGGGREQPLTTLVVEL